MMSAKRVRLPWISQLDSQSASPMDCGQACVLMLARKWGYAEPSLTVDDLYARAPAPGGTVYSDLQRLAAGIRSTQQGRDFVLSAGPNPTAAILRGYIDQGYPPILLVNYESLGIPRPDLVGGARAVGLHWLVVSGYDGGDFLVHDPLWRPADREGQGGAYVPVVGEALMQALRGVNLHHWMAVDAPPPPQVKTALGFHVVQGPRNGFREALLAGPALVKSVDDAGVLLETKQLSSNTVTIFRSRLFGDTPPGNFTGNPEEAACSWMDSILPHWENVAADYFEPVNEPDPETLDGYRWLNDFTMACMQIAETERYRLCLYNFAAGVPEDGELQALIPSLAHASQAGHILGLHEYGLPGLMQAGYPHLATRYRRVHARLEAAGVTGLRMAITEAAPFGGYEWDRLGKGAFVEDVTWYNGMVKPDAYVIGFALYSLGQWEGHRNNYQDALPDLIQIMKQE